MTHRVWFFFGLAASNVFMTFAWYAHLKNLGGKPCLVGAVWFIMRDTKLT